LSRSYVKKRNHLESHNLTKSITRLYTAANSLTRSISNTDSTIRHVLQTSHRKLWIGHGRVMEFDSANDVLEP